MAAEKSSLPITLWLKSLVVGTPFEILAKDLRWLLEARQRYAHPELWELYLEERRFPLVLQRLLNEESSCIDVGGHIGSFLRLLKKYAPKGQHSVFEASSTKSRWLKNRFPDVRVFPYAVSDRTGRAVFEEHYARSGYSALQRETAKVRAECATYEVETRRLDDVLLEMERVDLIKLDIEGGELAALRGAVGKIKKCNPAIIFECGSEYWLAKNNLSRLELYNFITGDLRYDLFSFSDFLFEKGSMSYEEFRKYGLYPFRGFNFLALPRPAGTQN